MELKIFCILVYCIIYCETCVTKNCLVCDTVYQRKTWMADGQEYKGHACLDNSQGPITLTTCSGKCYSHIVIKFPMQQQTNKLHDIYSNHITIDRGCYKGENVGESCSKVTNEKKREFTSTCRAICHWTGCNSKSMFRTFIKDKVAKVFQVCLDCVTERSLDGSKALDTLESCNRDKDIMVCFTSCYVTILIGANKQLTIQRGCVQGISVTANEKPTVLESTQGVWISHVCSLHSKAPCNSNPAENLAKELRALVMKSLRAVSPKQYVSEVKYESFAIELGRKLAKSTLVCLVCKSSQTSGSPLSDCEMGKANSLFNIQHCVSSCISYSFIENGERNVRRGCYKADVDVEKTRDMQIVTVEFNKPLQCTDCFTMCSPRNIICNTAEFHVKIPKNETRHLGNSIITGSKSKYHKTVSMMKGSLGYDIPSTSTLTCDGCMSSTDARYQQYKNIRNKIMSDRGIKSSSFHEIGNNINIGRRRGSITRSVDGSSFMSSTEANNFRINELEKLGKQNMNARKTIQEKYSSNSDISINKPEIVKQEIKAPKLKLPPRVDPISESVLTHNMYRPNGKEFNKNEIHYLKYQHQQSLDSLLSRKSPTQADIDTMNTKLNADIRNTKAMQRRADRLDQSFAEIKGIAREHDYRFQKAFKIYKATGNRKQLNIVEKWRKKAFKQVNEKYKDAIPQTPKEGLFTRVKKPFTGMKYKFITAKHSFRTRLGTVRDRMNKKMVTGGAIAVAGLAAIVAGSLLIPAYMQDNNPPDVKFGDVIYDDIPHNNDNANSIEFIKD